MSRGPVAVVAAGVVAAILLGSVAPVGPVVSRDLGLSLQQLGWSISAVTAISAALATPVGAWTRRRDGRAILAAGLGLLAVTGLAAAVAWDAGSLLAARLLQGAGYVLVVVVGPRLIVRLTEGPARTVALALWGPFIPIGLAAASLAGGVAGSLAGWRWWLAACGLLAAAAAAASLLVLPAERAAPDDAVAPVAPAALGRPLLLAGGFAAFTCVGVAMVGLLPSLLVERDGAPLSAAGIATAAVSLTSVGGSVVAAWLLRRGIGLAALAPAVLTLPPAAWVLFSPGTGLPLQVAAAAWSLTVNGLLVAAAFAALPGVARGASIDVVNGLVVQLGSLGTLAGPPLLGAVAAVPDPRGAALVVLCLAVAAAILLPLAARVSAGRAGVPRAAR